MCLKQKVNISKQIPQFQDAEDGKNKAGNRKQLEASGEHNHRHRKVKQGAKEEDEESLLRK